VDVDPAVVDRLRDGGGVAERAAAACLDTAGRIAALERHGADAVAAFRERHGDAPVTTVPELPLDVHDRLGVDLMARHLGGV
jgi:hypothetical protein